MPQTPDLEPRPEHKFTFGLWTVGNPGADPFGPAVRARLSRIHVPEAQRDYLHLNLYAVHQRVAKSFRSGRVFLCGDAAHVNNPIGGREAAIVSTEGSAHE